MLHKGQYGIYKLAFGQGDIVSIIQAFEEPTDPCHVCSGHAPVVHVDVGRHRKPLSLQCSCKGFVCRQTGPVNTQDSRRLKAGHLLHDCIRCSLLGQLCPATEAVQPAPHRYRHLLPRSWYQQVEEDNSICSGPPNSDIYLYQVGSTLCLNGTSMPNRLAADYQKLTLLFAQAPDLPTNQESLSTGQVAHLSFLSRN